MTPLNDTRTPPEHQILLTNCSRGKARLGHSSTPGTDMGFAISMSSVFARLQSPTNDQECLCCVILESVALLRLGSDAMHPKLPFHTASCKLDKATQVLNSY